MEPWTESAEAPRLTRGIFNDIVVPFVLIGLDVGALLLAVRNVRLGRGDRRGGFRVGLALVGLTFVKGLMGADFDGTLLSSMLLVFFTLARALLLGALFWAGYIALEPSVRRQWPHTLISWSRLLVGRWRDPLVGRDVLAGCALGVLAQAPFSVNAWVSSAPVTFDLAALDGVRFALAVVVGRAGGAVLVSTGILLGLFVLTLIVRRRWIAVALVLLFFGLDNSGGTAAQGLQALIIAAIIGLLLFCGARPLSGASSPGCCRSRHPARRSPGSRAVSIRPLPVRQRSGSQETTTDEARVTKAEGGEPPCDS